MNGKIKKISLMMIVIAFIIIIVGIVLFILFNESNTSKDKNEYIDNVDEYSENVSIDNIKVEENKALYLVLGQTHKTGDDYVLLKKDNNKFLFREKNTDICYEVDLDDFLVNSITNCNYEVNK